MRVQQLKYILKVAEVGSITEAAKLLFISQPSLSNSIKETEKEAGITIFLRSRTGITLTKDGAEFLGYARQVIQQMELLEDVTSRRRAIVDGYRDRLRVLEEKGIARLMGIPGYAEPNGHIFYLRFETGAQRDYVKDFLAHREIESKTHYVPLHMSPQGQRLGYRADDLMEASKCFETLLRLPVHGQMVGEQMEFVAGMVLKACGL